MHKLSYWHSAIVAAAHTLGCHILYSEDMSDARAIDGVRIVSPFRQLLRRLASCPRYDDKIRRPASSSMSLTHAPCITSACILRPAS